MRTQLSLCSLGTLPLRCQRLTCSLGVAAPPAPVGAWCANTLCASPPRPPSSNHGRGVSARVCHQYLFSASSPLRAEGAVAGRASSTGELGCERLRNDVQLSARSRSGLRPRPWPSLLPDSSREAGGDGEGRLSAAVSETARPRPAPRPGDDARDVGCGSGFEMTRVIATEPMLRPETLPVGEAEGRMVDVDWPRGRVRPVARVLLALEVAAGAAGERSRCGGVMLTWGRADRVFCRTGSDLDCIADVGGRAAS